MARRIYSMAKENQAKTLRNCNTIRLWQLHLSGKRIGLIERLA